MAGAGASPILLLLLLLLLSSWLRMIIIIRAWHSIDIRLTLTPDLFRGGGGRRCVCGRWWGANGANSPNALPFPLLSLLLLLLL